MPIRAPGLIALLAVLLTPLPAWPQEPVYKDLERSGPTRLGPSGRPAHGAPLPVGPPHPARVYTRDPGYVGSDYGLGKPAFTGLGSRPDWGRGGE